MSEAVDLGWIGATLRAIQAEQRSIRDENKLIRSALNEAITVIMERIGNFEAYVDTRIDLLEDRLDTKSEQHFAAVTGRLDRIERLLTREDKP